MAAAYLAYRDKDDVVVKWLGAQAVEQDEVEARRRIAAKTGRDEDDMYVVNAARELVQTDVKDGNQ